MGKCILDRIFYEVNGAYYSQQTPYNVNMLWLKNCRLLDQNMRLNQFLLDLVRKKGIKPVSEPWELNIYHKNTECKNYKIIFINESPILNHKEPNYQ